MESKITLKLLTDEHVPVEVRSLIPAGGGIIKHAGLLFYSIGNGILCCSADGEEAKVLYAMQQDSSHPYQADTAEGVFCRLLLGDTRAAAERLMDMRILDRRLRTVVLFHTESTPEVRLHELFSEIVPREDKDYILPVTPFSVAVIKDCAHREKSEIAEYAAAVIETLEGEGTTGLTAGIGGVKPDLVHLQEAYTEALRALETGRRYHPGKRVCLFDDCTLERIIQTIPEPQCREIRDRFLEKCEGLDLNAELTETVEVFFRNDLNLSAASKQLFIHRNTLNYRLDKIRRETGLDLRCFRDAVIFRVMLDFLNDTHLNK